MSGAWVFVCGPSGAGKDSVLAWAREALAGRSDIVFARRLITRPAQPGSDHDPVDPDEHALLRASAALAWHWQAHGFGYAVPMRYARQVAWGRIVVVNGSREHAQAIVPGPPLRRVLITAPPAQLAGRLRRRGRDEPAAIAARLARNARAALDADLVIHNDAAIAVAGARLQCFLETLTAGARHVHAATA